MHVYISTLAVATFFGCRVTCHEMTVNVKQHDSCANITRKQQDSCASMTRDQYDSCANMTKKQHDSCANMTRKQHDSHVIRPKKTLI